MLVAPLSGTGLRKEMAGRVEDAANETIGEVRSAIQRRVAALAIRVGLNLEPGSDLRKEQSRAGRCAILVHRLFQKRRSLRQLRGVVPGPSLHPQPSKRREARAFPYQPGCCSGHKAGAV